MNLSRVDKNLEQDQEIKKMLRNCLKNCKIFTWSSVGFIWIQEKWKITWKL